MCCPTLKDQKMAMKSSDIRPYELVREALHLAQASWKQVAISAGIFALISGLIAVFASGASKEFAQLGQMCGMFAMFLATLTASLVTSARALGVEIPTLASALINDRNFWRYVWGGIVCTFLAGLVMVVALLAGLATMPTIPVPGIKDPSALDLTPIYYAVPVGAVLSMLLSVRLSMLLPAIVVGEKVSVSKSWKRTRGLTAKLAIAAGMALGGFYVLQLLVTNVGGYAFGPEGAPFIETLAAAVRIARNAVEGALVGIVMAKILDDEAVTQPA
jgi:hypothetical protein